MEFEKWFEIFSENKMNLTNKSLKEMLEIAYIAGFIQCEKIMPLYGKSETGEISQLPREENTTLLDDDTIWNEDDVDLEKWLKRQGNQNATK